MRKIFFVFIVLLATVGNSAKAQHRIVNTFHIASGGGWDYIAVHDNKLYVSHSTQVNILDKNTGDSLGVIHNTTGVHGIAFNDEAGKGYTSNGKLNNVFVFDIATAKVLDSINTGKNPDAIIYESYTKKVITCNGRSNDLSVIDPVTNKVIATIAVGGKPETAVSNDAGMLYVNIEDKNEIVSIDLNTFTVKHHWSIMPGEEPTGLAIDNETNRLFAGCNEMLIVLDASNGKIVEQLPIGAGCDGVAFDNKTKTIYTSNGQDGTMTVIKEVSANEFAVIENTATKKSARTIILDQETHLLYLPAADMEPNTPEGQWPKMMPGTFQILVIDKK